MCTRSYGSVRPRVTIRKGTTKGKIETRSVPVNPDLRTLLEEYSSQSVYLFPGRHGLGHIHPDSADKILRAAFIELGIEGASTHSTPTHLLNPDAQVWWAVVGAPEDFWTQNLVGFAKIPGGAG